MMNSSINNYGVIIKEHNSWGHKTFTCILNFTIHTEMLKIFRLVLRCDLFIWYEPIHYV